MEKRAERFMPMSYLNLFGICIIRSYVFKGMVHTQMQTIIFKWNKQMTLSLLVLFFFSFFPELYLLSIPCVFFHNQIN